MSLLSSVNSGGESFEHVLLGHPVGQLNSLNILSDAFHHAKRAIVIGHQ